MHSYHEKKKYNPSKEQIWTKNHIKMKDLFWRENSISMF